MISDDEVLKALECDAPSHRSEPPDPPDVPREVDTNQAWNASGKTPAAYPRHPLSKMNDLEIGCAVMLIFVVGLSIGFGLVMSGHPALGHLVVYAMTAAILGVQAVHKNRNGWAWALIGGLFFAPALIALALCAHLCPSCRQPLSNKERKCGKCPHCGNNV
jgi:hypothetical protein